MFEVLLFAVAVSIIGARFFPNTDSSKVMTIALVLTGLCITGKLLYDRGYNDALYDHGWNSPAQLK
jgi:hypothetical protein